MTCGRTCTRTSCRRRREARDERDAERRPLASLAAKIQPAAASRRRETLDSKRARRPAEDDSKNARER